MKDCIQQQYTTNIYSIGGAIVSQMRKDRWKIEGCRTVCRLEFEKKTKNKTGLISIIIIITITIRV